MKIKFCGAAKTVTGSSHLLTTPKGKKILLDCGLYQGNEPEFETYNTSWPFFKPQDIEFLVLSHAHIDHIGRVPQLVKDGFKGNIICTNATRDLASIMLLDSAHIQEKDAEYINKRNYRKNKPPIDPIYTIADAKECLKQFTSIGYEKWFRIDEETDVLFRDSGHILGSASVTLKIKELNKDILFGFTGDIGRPNRPILKDPISMPQVDYLICESTYGGNFHKDTVSDTAQLLHIVNQTCVRRRGKLIIPAFSVGRTQEVVYMLDQLSNEGKLPRVPVYVDSPLAVNATEIFISNPDCFDDEILHYMTTDPNPFGFNNLKYVRTAEESKKINSLNGPCIIISASGMASAGRVKHHIANNIENPSTTILFVGFCSPGTLGNILRNGAEHIKVFGEEKKVKAHIEILDSFSAHGDQQEMLDYLANQDRKKLQQIFLVHGDPDRQALFSVALQEAGFKNVVVPNLGDEITL